MVKDQVNDITQRTRQYWFTDGLAELIAGISFLLLGLYFYLQVVLPRASLAANLLQAGFALFIIGCVLLGKRTVQALKERLTYPRTGFVAYTRANPRYRWLSAGLAVGIAAMIASLIVSTPAAVDWLPAVTGLVVAAVWLVTAARVGLLRFYLLAIISIVLGLGLSFSGLGDTFGVACYYASMGFALIFSGWTTLRSYLGQKSLNSSLTDEYR